MEILFDVIKLGRFFSFFLSPEQKKFRVLGVACFRPRSLPLFAAEEILQESPCLTERWEERRLYSGGGVVPPYKWLVGMCRWKGSRFHDWIDYNGVAFSIELLELGHTISDFLG